MTNSYLLLEVKQTLTNVRLHHPLVHHITNYVTANDCANITLAIGASPIMADEKIEVADITTLSQALVINIGTLNQNSAAAMLLASKKANDLGIPIILDPVGAGISSFRNQTLTSLLHDIHFTVIRGNLSEISYLAGYKTQPKGVDATSDDCISQLEKQEIASLLAKRYRCVVVITGKVDVVSDGSDTYLIKNGVSELQNITGTGCMLSSLVASCCGGMPKQPLVATLTALLIMGVCGELAVEKQTGQGSASLKIQLIDSVNTLSHTTLKERGQIEQTMP